MHDFTLLLLPVMHDYVILLPFIVGVHVGTGLIYSSLFVYECFSCLPS